MQDLKVNLSSQSPHNALEERDEIHYASVNFARNQTDPVYSNIRPAGPRGHKEEENVEYATVKFNNSASRWAALHSWSLSLLNLKTTFEFELYFHSLTFIFCVD